MYLQLTTDFIKAKKLLKIKDTRTDEYTVVKVYCRKAKDWIKHTHLCSDKRIWQLLWRGFSVDDVYKIVTEEYRYWDIPEYWEEKKQGIEMSYKFTYGKGSNRYKDYSLKIINGDIN
jgi:hypothetical protein|tara:strand:- start:36 stop:386 length:351 start_codon:yes stop_codon:yes gene_type:complete